MSPVLADDVRLEVPFVRDLAQFGDAPALLTTSAAITYAQLAADVDRAARKYATGRRLVLLAAHNAVEPIVEYLAAVRAGCPVMLVPDRDPEHLRAWVDRFDPDVVVAQHRGRWIVEERRATTAHNLHPELALLLSTSGSTGSPKFVRLSHENLQANAEQIADALGIAATDRAVLALPLTYSYGLSVLHSHLQRGAAVVVTEHSVVDRCFWDLVAQHRVTNLPGVPYTFDLLEHNGFAERDVPSLRLVTQAGGRMAPDTVARFAALGRERGWTFAVMYGQTEATARMAIATADDLATNMQTVGRPVANACVRISDAGELIFSGPNVMLGYAESAADFGRGRTIEELHTGDLARLDDDGRIEIIGRAHRFAKVFGLRIDLGRLEGALAAHGVRAACVSDDERLFVVAEGPGSQGGRVAALTQSHANLPASAVHVVFVEHLPRTPSGKVDNARCLALASTDLSTKQPPLPAFVTASTPIDDLCRVFSERLGRDATADDSFVTLGGDSLSYVEMSVVLEGALGRLPTDWHQRTIAELAQDIQGSPPRRRTRGHRWFGARSMDTTVVMRALAIIAVVGSHIPVFDHRGGAHLLLAVAGYNVARFQLTDADRRQRVRGLVSAIGRVALPSFVWLSIVVAVMQEYSLRSALFINTVVAGPEWSPGWRYWFVETLLYLLIGVTTLAAIPAIDRLERRWPFGLPMAIVAVGLVTRYGLVGDTAGPMHAFTPAFVIWLFALGWAAQRAVTVPHRVMVTAAALLTVPGFSANAERVTLVLIGVLALVWLRTVRVPGLVVRPLAVVAAASLWIYLSQWQVIELFPAVNGWLVLPLCLAVGIGLHALWEAVVLHVRGWRVRAHISARADSMPASAGQSVV